MCWPLVKGCFLRTAGSIPSIEYKKIALPVLDAASAVQNGTEIPGVQSDPVHQL